MADALLSRRFEEKVDRSGEHHLWVGSQKKDGTGKMKLDGRTVYARVIAWELAHGALTDGESVSLLCPEKACVRLEHLALATKGTPRPPATTKRRPRGTGGITELRPGVFEVIADLGKIDTGGRKRATKTVHGTRSEAEAVAKDLNAGSTKNVVFSGELAHATLDEMLGVYLDWLKAAGRAPNTLVGYRGVQKVWISPGGSKPQAHPIGHMKASRVTLDDIDGMFFAMRAAGLSASRMNEAEALLRGMYKWATRKGRKHLLFNPMLEFDKQDSDHEPKEPNPPTSEEAAIIIEAIIDRRPKIAALAELAAMTGMRREELCGLRRSSIGDNSVITVTHVVTDGGGEVGIRPKPKNKKRRWFAFDKATSDLLKLHIMEMDDRAATSTKPSRTELRWPELTGPLLPGGRLPEDPFLFSEEADCTKPMRPEFVTRNMRQVAEALDLGDIDVTLQAFRSFTSTELLDNDFSMAEVALRQGHTQEVLAKFYHARRLVRERQMADTIGTAFRMAQEDLRHTRDE